MNDFDTGDMGERADHFLLSANGFPPANVADLRLPVVAPDGDLDENARRSARASATDSPPCETVTRLFCAGDQLETNPRSARFDTMTRSHRDDGEDEQDGPDDEQSPTRIDISISVTDLLSDLLDDRRAETDRRTPGRRPRGRPTRAGHASGDGPTEGGSVDDDYRVESVRDGDELTVVADLLGADRADVTTGIDPERSELVVATGGRAVGRVSLPWDPVEVVETSFNNGILQVRLRPATDD
ncbi:GvpH protein [Halogeometricum rufum]|uniref:GvpH protein n=3 Tax=Halogeometricum TaxID=60846 RepID=A0A1I6G812_9EURY|nr:GvpH protein [Halogeometricum rufum]